MNNALIILLFEGERLYDIAMYIQLYNIDATRSLLSSLLLMKGAEVLSLSHSLY